MCGICGVWGNEKRAAIEDMVASLDHRGPDDQGFYCDDHVALGMTRLAVIDVSPAGRQPMGNADGTVWLVYNGEVYNFQGERKILENKGYSFHSSSDTEVVLHMYEHYGDDFLLRLRGMFALAIYDRRRGQGCERLLLARDHLGIKPLLFARKNGRIIFASEAKALLASGLVEADIDPMGLHVLLSFGSVCQPRTILRDVQMLLPAHRLIVERSGERLERYWSFGLDRKPWLRTQQYEPLVEEVEGVLRDSVRLQLMSDVPLGAFLSGGVDSSTLVGIMVRALGHRVKTYSVGFEEEGMAIDESQDARRTAGFLGTDHTHVLVKGTDVRDRIRHIAWSLDQPSVDGINSYFVSLAARKGVTVAISGTGADEIFAGYPWFISMALHQHRREKRPYRDLAASLISAAARQRIFGPLLRMRGGSTLQRIRNYGGILPRYASNHQIFDTLTVGKLLLPEFQWSAQGARSIREELIMIDELPRGSTIERATGMYLRGYTNNQLLRDIDAVSMAHSLEVRVPYLDPVVVDTALSLPDSAKLAHPSELASVRHWTYRETGAKRILIDIGRKYLPENFDLQPKRGFAMPFEAWLKGALRETLLETLSESTVRKRGLLDPMEVMAVRKDFFEGHLGWQRPWLLMMLELWCQEVLDKRWKD